MRKEAYMTVKVAYTPDEAVQLVHFLRLEGLHPADVALTAPLTTPGTKPIFPVEVPTEEGKIARKLLNIGEPTEYHR